MRFYPDPKPRLEMSEQEVADFMAKCMLDFHYFSEIVMGYHDLNEEHQKLCHFIANEKSQRKLALLPRLTFKSSLITQGYTIWETARKPNTRTLIYSDSTPKAQGFLRGIKNNIEGRSGLWKSYFGDWKSEDTWNENQIIVNRRTKGSVEPTVDTSGIDASKVGMHYDRIIFDDIVSDMNVTNKQQMDKVYDCYKRSLSLLTRSGEIIIVGTRWHFGDMYGRLIAENEDTHEYDLIIKDAEEIRKEGVGLIFDNIGKESLTKQHLDRLRDTQGSYTYSCLYRNNPVDDEEALFKSDKFGFYGKLEVSPSPIETGMYDFLYITGTVDPAGMGGDRTGGIVCGTDKDMNIYILDVLNKHLQPHQIIDWVIEMNFKYHLRMLGIETKFFRGMLRKELENRIREEQVKNVYFHNFGIKEFSPSKGETKFIRVQALQPCFERGDIFFPGKSIHTQKAGFSDLAHQMLQVTPTHMPEPNDLIDALAFQVPLWQAGGIVKTEDIPKNSPADLERIWVKEWNHSQKMLPRRMRRNYKPWLS